MDRDNLKSLLDACFTAKHVIETLPELPKGMKPRHIHVLERVGIVCKEHGVCRVSDVSEGLNITMPSITKLVQELDAMYQLEKYPDPADKRVALLRLTKEGELCVQKYVIDFQSKWAGNLSSIPNDEVQKAIRLIELLEQTMPDR